MATRKEAPITQKDVQRALQEFRRRGGLIRKLPPERTGSAHTVRARRDVVERLTES